MAASIDLPRVRISFAPDKAGGLKNEVDAMGAEKHF